MAAHANVINAYLNGNATFIQKNIVGTWINNFAFGHSKCLEDKLFVEFLIAVRLFMEAFGFTRLETVSSLASIIKCFSCYNCKDTDVEIIADYFNGEEPDLPVSEEVTCGLHSYIISDSITYKIL